MEDRLAFLAEFQSVDFVFGFEDIPNYASNPEIFTQRYRDLFPNAVAVSSWDPNTELKRMQANDAGIDIVFIDHGRRNSSTRLLQMIGYE